MTAPVTLELASRAKKAEERALVAEDLVRTYHAHMQRTPIDLEVEHLLEAPSYRRVITENQYAQLCEHLRAVADMIARLPEYVRK